MARHVVLVGLMGSGKTTVGRRVAAHLQRHFVDADAALEQISDRTIADIFEREGEQGFRDLEADTFEELLEHHDPTVIAAGGGLVIRAENRRRLRRPDITVVFLDASPEFLASRISRKASRPLLAGDVSARDVLERLAGERRPLYEEVADLTVDVEPFHASSEKPKQAMAERIAELVLAHEANDHEVAS